MDRSHRGYFKLAPSSWCQKRNIFRPSDFCVCMPGLPVWSLVWMLTWRNYHRFISSLVSHMFALWAYIGRILSSIETLRKLTCVGPKNGGDGDGRLRTVGCWCHPAKLGQSKTSFGRVLSGNESIHVVRIVIYVTVIRTSFLMPLARSGMAQGILIGIA